MLLTIDVGNTNITLGVFKEEVLLGTFRMTTKRPRTSDEYGFTICGILEHRNICPQDIHAVIIASVVPDIMHSLTSGIIKYLNVRPLIVSAGIKTGIRIVTENPKEIGPDRIVDAVAGYELFGGPVIVVDFGTATTYDLIGTLPLGRRSHAPGDRDPQAGVHTGEGDHFQYAGGAGVRRYRADGIHHPEDQGGIRVSGR